MFNMKFLVVGDLHGSKPNVYFKDFDAIVAPGDFCSTDEIRKYQFQLLQKKIDMQGFNGEWYDIPGREKAKEIIEKSLEDGRKILEHLDSFGVPVYIVPGNVDFFPSKQTDWEYFNQNHYANIISDLKNIVDIHQRIVDVGNYNMIGNGVSRGPEYPQNERDLIISKNQNQLEKQKEDYDRISKKLSSLFVTASKPVIFLSHNVPFNTTLDEITDKKSPNYGYHCGSVIARDMIEKFSPLVCIGGHIHEHFEKCEIGKTVCINSGFGSDVNILLELEKNGIRNLEFHKSN
jgi:Icc-related predicted phosphoesterase